MRTFALLLLVAAACNDDAIDSDEEARRAYLGLDSSIEASIDLGFQGFNSADSANIAPQTGAGAASGTLTVSGQVDQGSSANKEMRLHVGMVAYSDGVIVVATDDGDVEVDLTYETSAVETDQPYLHLSLRDVPDGTFSGELTGRYQLAGDIDGAVELTLTMTGDIMGASDGTVSRVPGSTSITGTATSGDGRYDVDVTL